MKRIAWAVAVASMLATTALAEAPAVLFILDASGSMMAKVQGKPKIEVARAVMSDLVRKLEPDVRIGLVTYGHRRKQDCSDIELIAPLGADRAAVLKAVSTLNPKGETPLTDAIRQAASALKETEGAASVVVVSDGKESCGGDPCAAAREAVAAGVHLRIHVVGFDVSQDEAMQLQCVAKEGKGRYFSAANAAELGKALAEVQKEVAAPTPVPPTPEPTRPAATPTPVPAAKSGAKLRAVLAAGQPAIGADLAWEVFEPGADIEGRRRKLAFSYDPSPFFELPPGQYVISVKRGDAAREMEFEVKPGEATSLEVVLDAGRVKAVAKLAADQPPIEKDVAWEMFESAADIEGNRKKVAFSYDASPVFTIHTGKYVLHAKRGDAATETELEIGAGEEKRVELVLGAGRTKLTAKPAPQSSPIEKDLAWEVFETKPDIEGNRRKVAFSYEASPIFTLASGHYLVRAERGNARAEMEFDSRPGQDQRLELVLDAGVVQASAKLAPTEAPLGVQVNWEVFEAKQDLDGSRKKVAFSFDPSPQFTLNAGRYVVRAAREQKWGETEVEVKAGEKQNVEVVLGQVKE